MQVEKKVYFCKTKKLVLENYLKWQEKYIFQVINLGVTKKIS